MDYELLGGLLGSAWHDQHNYQTSHEDRIAVARTLLRIIGIEDTPAEAKMRLPLIYTMQGRCYNCGRDTSTRWSVGVYTCPVCAINKPGVTIEQSS